MWKRGLFDIVGILLVFMVPWWIVLIYGLVGIFFFSWYIELIIFGAIYDALYGSRMSLWYRQVMHTGIFAGVLLVSEFIKTNLRR